MSANDGTAKLTSDDRSKQLTVAIIAIDCCLFVVFFLEFFPRGFLAQASVLTGLASGLLTLVGMKWGRGSLALRLSRQMVLRVALAFLGVITALLLIGIARPFQLHAVPGASVYVDGRLVGRTPSSADDAPDGLATANVYASWEPHEFSIRKQYFLDLQGEPRPVATITWWQMHLLPIAEFNMRACLGPGDGNVEWPTSQSENADISTSEGVGIHSLRLLLLALDRLATSGHAALPVAVQCGRSVELKSAVSPKPFSSGDYLSIELKPGVQARIDVSPSARLPERITEPAKLAARALLRLLDIESDVALRKVDAEIDAQAQPLLLAINDRPLEHVQAAISRVESAFSTLEEIDPCDPESQVLPYKVVVSRLGEVVIEAQKAVQVINQAGASAGDGIRGKNLIRDLEGAALTLIGHLEDAGVLAKYLSGNPQAEQVLAGLEALERESKSESMKQRAAAAVAKVRTGVKDCPGQTVRDRRTGKTIKLPAGGPPKPYRQFREKA